MSNLPDSEPRSSPKSNPRVSPVAESDNEYDMSPGASSFQGRPTQNSPVRTKPSYTWYYVAALVVLLLAGYWVFSPYVGNPTATTKTNQSLTNTRLRLSPARRRPLLQEVPPILPRQKLPNAPYSPLRLCSGLRTSALEDIASLYLHSSMVLSASA